MMTAEEFLWHLWKLRNGRKATIICGGGWGDSGKGVVEGEFAQYFEVFVRVSGGANTGRTRHIMTSAGQKEFIFHLIPSGWADNKTAIIGDWVLIDLQRLSEEINNLTALLGQQPTAPLYISRKAPIFLPYHRFLEAYLELCKGDQAVKTTGRGIAPIIAGIDLRIGPTIGHLEYPDTLQRWITDFYNIFEDDFKKLERALADTESRFNLSDFTPDKVTEQILTEAKAIIDFIVNIDSILIDFMRRNIAVLFGLTQGYGLHKRGTYPFNSTTQTTAQAVPYCSGIPIQYFGSILQVEKLLPTRVGAGPFPTGLWGRQVAEQHPKDFPDLFTPLAEFDERKRRVFLEQYRTVINGGDYSNVDLAKYFQVLLNELGATTKRGRELGWPDLFMTACSAVSNGADCLVLTRVDALSHLKLNFKLGCGYWLGDSKCQVPDYPNPIERLEQVRVQYQEVPVDLQGVDLYSATELPGCVEEILKIYKDITGVPVGMVSTSPRMGEGKIFRNIF